jgi:hypothetical protein
MQDTATWPSMRRILIISLHLYRVSASTIRQTVRVFRVPLDSASGLYEMGNFSMLSDLQKTL